MLSGIYDSGGFTKVVENLANELGSRGVDVTVSALSFKRLPSKGKYSVCAFPVGNIIRQTFLDSFDIIHNHHPLTNYLSFATHTPFIYHYHGAPNSGNGYLFRLNMFSSVRLVKNNFDSTIAVSKNGADELKRYFKITNLHIVPNGVNTSYFKPNLEEKFRKGTPQLLFVGNLYEHKRVEDLLHSMKLLVKAYPDIHLNIVGNGPTYPKLKNLANALSIEKYVSFCGFIHHDVLPYFYSSCDLYVTASSCEQFPLPLAEAWACGKPVVASSINSHQELLLESKAGKIFQLGNINDLCAAIADVYERRFSFIYDATKFAKEHAWSVIANQLMEIYTNVLLKYRAEFTNTKSSILGQ